jgi:hypothetical protein
MRELKLKKLQPSYFGGKKAGKSEAPKQNEAPKTQAPKNEAPKVDTADVKPEQVANTKSNGKK